MEFLDTLRGSLATMPTPFNMLVVWIALLECLIITPLVLLNRPDVSAQGGSPKDGNPKDRNTEWQKRFLFNLLAVALPMNLLMILAAIWQFML